MTKDTRTDTWRTWVPTRSATDRDHARAIQGAGVDMSSFIEARRKDFRGSRPGCGQPGRVRGDAGAGAHASYMLTQTMQGIQETAKGSTGGKPDAAKQAEGARDAWQKMLADMKTLAEMARTSRRSTLFRQPDRAAGCGNPRKPRACAGPEEGLPPPGVSTGERRHAMKALVYHGPGQKALEERPMPALAAPTDAIVRITKTTICGTDLHILKGDVPTCAPGRILGHEGVGVVDEVGRGRHRLQARRPGADLLHLVLRQMRVLPQGHVLALHDRRLDPRQHDRRHPGRISCASRMPTPASTGSRRRRRRGAGHAERHPADRLRMRRAERQGRSRATRSRSSAPGRSAWRRC